MPCASTVKSPSRVGMLPARGMASMDVDSAVIQTLLAPARNREAARSGRSRARLPEGWPRRLGEAILDLRCSPSTGCVNDYWYVIATPTESSENVRLVELALSMIRTLNSDPKLAAVHDRPQRSFVAPRT